MSLRLGDLSRWALPPMASPREGVYLLSSVEHAWELMPTHLQWIQDCTARYGFDDDDETLRHLLYLANSESPKHKKLIFRIKRCLHCHVGARGSQHKKVILRANIHQFQWEWLQNVTNKCEIKSVEKSVRIVCDFYQSRVQEASLRSQEEGVAKEREMFSVRRESDARLAQALEDGTYLQAKNETQGCNLDSLQSDPAACSAEETLKAIRKCQVGRGSTSYSTALGETAEETAARRSKEILIEQSEEAKRDRLLIRKALGSVMG
mmetsp:Transcript_10964/g.16145  ORF Transcript_10964/g.16145 Transcript_10964/m.16145 type:complete len:264 (-) Transcript_10964:98-889(-)